MVEVTPGRAARDVALVAVVFAAALVLLVGMSSVVSRSAPGSSSRPASSVAAAAASMSPGASAEGSGDASAPSPGASGAGAGPASGAPVPATPDPSLIPGPTEDVVLVGAGDIADCEASGDEATARLVEAIPGIVFAAGDDAYPSGTLKEFQDCYGPSWGRFLDRTLLPVPGNHEWETPKIEGYLDYFGSRAQPNGTSWYSMDLGAWHVIVLDSECDKVGGCTAGSAQGRWLRDDLAVSTERCTLAIWHRPRWSSGQHGDDRRVAPFWDALYAAGADLVVNGHDHDYERFAPQDPAGVEDRTRGIREFVVGTGGAELRKLTHDAANSELAVGEIAGVIKLTLKPDGYAWDFTSVTGEISDRGAAACH